MVEKPTKRFSDFPGAFADTAVLFPLLATLSIHNGMSFTLLLVTSGLLYILSGYFYRLPMSIQPLKSIAIAGLTLGATATEIRASSAGLALLLLGLLFFDINRVETLVPKVLIHGIQASLGILLIIQGYKYASALSVYLVAAGVFLILTLLAFDRFTRVPALGWFSVLAILIAIYTSASSPLAVTPSPQVMEAGIRWPLIIGLVLPQFLLTMNNSVLATCDVTKRYFGAGADRVTARSLITFVGLGNIVLAMIGGLPFCHGSGGITARFKGGARTYRSNLIIGGFLVLLSLLALALKIKSILFYPVFLFIILSAVGLFHLKLAEPSWQTSSKPCLIGMCVMSALTQNILYAFFTGVIILLSEKSICLVTKRLS